MDVDVVEVLRACSRNYDLCTRLPRTLKRLQRTQNDHTESPPEHTAARQGRPVVYRYPPEVIDQMLATYKGGATAREVAAQFDVAHSSVIRLLKHHGITARRKSPSQTDVDEAVALYQAGETLQLIAEHLGYGASTIARANKTSGVCKRGSLPRRETRPGSR